MICRFRKLEPSLSSIKEKSLESRRVRTQPCTNIGATGSVRLNASLTEVGDSMAEGGRSDGQLKREPRIFRCRRPRVEGHDSSTSSLARPFASSSPPREMIEVRATSHRPRETPFCLVTPERTAGRRLDVWDTTARVLQNSLSKALVFPRMGLSAINILAEDKHAIQNRRCEVIIDSVHRCLLAGLIVPCHRLWKQSP
jgi:hypothetical protein